MSAASKALTTSDRALLQAWKGWGSLENARLWNRFSPEWRGRLEAIVESAGPITSDPDSLRESLRREHSAEARPDLSRVHASWSIRALQEETPAVRRAVIARLPSRVREAVRLGIPSPENDVEPDHDPHPEALKWALTLWSERLVGGPAARPDDPPVIVALTRPDRHSRVRLIATTGLAKLAFALAGFNDETPPREPHGLRPRERERLLHFRRTLRPEDPKIAQMAKRDVIAARSDGEPFLNRLGLITYSRLLAGAEPHRVRWALQQLPYPVAKVIRSRMGASKAAVPANTLLAWESAVLRAACARLRAEGRHTVDGGNSA